jgi:hypothetical protein
LELRGFQRPDKDKAVEKLAIQFDRRDNSLVGVEP